MKKDSTHRGFMLIELIAVSVVISVLTGFVLFSVNTAKVSADSSQHVKDLKK